MTTAILDTRLLVRFQQGEQIAFKKVFSFYYPRLLYFAKRLTSNDEEAEDITSKAFFTLFNRCAKFETENNIKAFLYIAVRNASLSYLRSVKTKTEQQRKLVEKVQNDIHLEYEYGIQEELLDRVKMAIEKLPPKCRTVFKMMYFDELTTEEIATALKISPNTVYAQKQYAIKVLRLSLGEHSLALAWILYLIISAEKDMVSTLHVINV